MNLPKITTTIATLLILSGCAHYQPDPWTTQDTERHVAMTVLQAIDWRQTKHIAKNGHKFYECNRILDDHPSQNEVDLYFAVSWVAKTGIAYVLDEEWRKRWQWVCIGSSAGCVGWNYYLGIEMEF